MRALLFVLGLALLLIAMWGGFYTCHALNPEPVEAGARFVMHWATPPVVLTGLTMFGFGVWLLVSSCNDDW